MPRPSHIPLPPIYLRLPVALAALAVAAIGTTALAGGYTCTPGGPVNDCATNATPMTPGELLVFSTSTANTDGPTNFQCSYGKDIWYLIQAPDEGEFTVVVETPSFDSTLAVYYLGTSPEFDPASLALLFTGCVDAEALGGETAVFPAVADVYYLLQVAGFDSGGGAQSGPGATSATFVGPSGCGSPGSGSCFTPHAALGCDDNACCQTVCDFDPFCCKVAWDQACVDLASLLCEPQPLPAPLEIDLRIGLDTGPLDNPGDDEAVLFSGQVAAPGASWLRLYFSAIALPPGSRVRITSLLDGETQELDQTSAVEWGNGSAYFNGEAVLVEIIGGPNTAGNQLVLDHVGANLTGSAICSDDPCGTCGTDARTPSNELWSGRYVKGGCTASVVSPTGMAVSAGHCWTPLGAVLMFNVPASNSDCSSNVPSVLDQFPVVATMENGGPYTAGDDWRVIQLGTNPAKKTHYQRYATFMPLASTPAPVGAAIDVHAYGNVLSPPSWNHAQLHSPGMSVLATSSVPALGGSPPNYSYTMGGGTVTGGNSGCGIVHDSHIIGVLTHCAGPCNSFGTRLDHPSFAQALHAVLPECTAPPTDMLAWWPLDQLATSGVTSELAMHNDTWPVGPVGQLVGGKVGKAVSWTSGSLGPLRATPGPGYSFLLGGFTIDAWIYLDSNSVGNQSDILSSPDLSLGWAGYSFYAFGSGASRKLAFVACDPIYCVCGTATSIGTLSLDQWHHVAVAGPPHSGGPTRPVTFYIDGQPAGTATLGNGVISINTGWPMNLGGSKGLTLDELEMFSRDLSQSEVEDLFNAGSAGKCKASCSAEWDAPFCEDAASAASIVTICNKEAVPQTYHLTFAGLPAGTFGSQIDGPTDFTVMGSNPVTVPPGQCLPIQIAIQRPASMVTVYQVGAYEVTVWNIESGQAMTCHGSVEDRRDICASLVDPCCPSWMLVSPGESATAGVVLVNTTDFLLAGVGLWFIPYGPDMLPSTTMSIEGLPAGKPFQTIADLAPGVPVSVTAEFVLGTSGLGTVSSIVVFTDMNNDGALEPLRSITVASEFLFPHECPADLTGDRLVDGQDLGLLLGAWGTGDALADINQDGEVSGGDLGALLTGWGACPE